MRWFEKLAKRDPNPRYLEQRDGPEPYLVRYTIFRLPFLKIMIHKILATDWAPAMHDHPWPFFHVILSGSYIEQNSSGKHLRRRGHLAFRASRYTHRLILRDSNPVWTLVIRGPRIRAWGFYCRRVWVFWRDYVSGNNPDAC